MGHRWKHVELRPTLSDKTETIYRSALSYPQRINASLGVPWTLELLRLFTQVRVVVRERFCGFYKQSVSSSKGLLTLVPFSIKLEQPRATRIRLIFSLRFILFLGTGLNIHINATWWKQIMRTIPDGVVCGMQKGYSIQSFNADNNDKQLAGAARRNCLPDPRTSYTSLIQHVASDRPSPVTNIATLLI